MQAPEDSHDARVDGVAAQLVARERRAIEDKDANAGASKDGRRHGTSRTRARNDDVKHKLLASL
jgi:hypothetical protein